MSDTQVCILVYGQQWTVIVYMTNMKVYTPVYTDTDCILRL